ncbi:hypothetical protein ACH5RR_031598 [Cinchona calisaya]|uniref:Mitochondrial import receptor subunit TOM22 n=1 Tax=Cinchona calisaya TaxID=153742 RepID=A0ABD2YHM9_9GENT
MAFYGGKRMPASKSKNAGTIITTTSDSSLINKGKKVACDVAYVGKKLLKSTGKAAWITATTFLILGLPLVLSMEREQLLEEYDLQNQALLGAPPSSISPPQPYGGSST